MATDPSGREADDAEGDDDGEEWRFSLADIEERTADESEDMDEDGDAGNIAGALSPDETIEAGDIDIENAVFVLLGVVLAVLVLAGFANVLP